SRLIPSTVTTASSMKSGAVSTFQPSGHVSYFAIRKSRTGRPITKSTSGTMTLANGKSVLGKYTLVTSGRFDKRLRLARLRADAKYCIGSTPATTRLGYGVVPDGKFANFPKTIT